MRDASRRLRFSGLACDCGSGGASHPCCCGQLCADTRWAGVQLLGRGGAGWASVSWAAKAAARALKPAAAQALDGACDASGTQRDVSAAAGVQASLQRALRARTMRIGLQEWLMALGIISRSAWLNGAGSMGTY